MTAYCQTCPLDKRTDGVSDDVVEARTEDLGTAQLSADELTTVVERTGLGEGTLLATDRRDGRHPMAVFAVEALERGRYRVLRGLL